MRPRQTDSVQKKNVLIKLPKKDSGTTHAKGSPASNMCHNTPPQSLLPLLPGVHLIRGAMHSLCVRVYCLFLSVLDAESTTVNLLSVSLSTTCYPCCFREASKWDCTHPTPTHISQQPTNGTVPIPLPPTLHSSQQMELYTSHSHPHFTAASKWNCTPPTPTHTLQQPANGTVHIPFPPTLCSSQQMELCTHPAATVSDV